MEEAGGPGEPGPEVKVNPLEASGKVEFFVRVTAAGGVIRGESRTRGYENFIPAIRFFSNINKGPTGAVKCTAFRFTKAVDISSPPLAGALSTGETLPNVRMDFVRNLGGGLPIVWQRLELTGMRIAKVEQAVAPEEEFSASTLLEEVTLEPVGTANVVLTAFEQLADGRMGPAIPQPFSCKR
jgi:type VI protein secretion system component Hcp